MNKKFFLTAISIIAIIFLSFCNVDDKPVKSSNTNNDIVKELKSYYEKQKPDILNILDQKGLTKVVEIREIGTEDPSDPPSEYQLISYINSDTTIRYAFLFSDNILAGCSYEEEVKHDNNNKVSQNNNKNIINIQKSLVYLNNQMPSNTEFYGVISSNNGKFEKDYDKRNLFLTELKAKKSILDYARYRFIFNDVDIVEVSYYKHDKQSTLYIYYGIDLTNISENLKW